MTTPPIQLDEAAINAMRALAVARQTDPQDPAEVQRARAELVAARKARGY